MYDAHSLPPKPCPILEVTEVGDVEPKIMAPGADICTDLPRYRIFQQHEWVEETTEIQAYWHSDLVAFLIGCSFSFEDAMLNAGLSLRHVEEGKNVPMYQTSIPCRPGGVFNSPLVVSMRPLPAHQVSRAFEVTSRYVQAHGSPIHIGNPDAIGIHDLMHPDFGDAVTVKDDEVPVFWSCRVTTQIAIMNAKPQLAITHAPGCMFLCDQKHETLCLLKTVQKSWEVILLQKVI